MIVEGEQHLLAGWCPRRERFCVIVEGNSVPSTAAATATRGWNGHRICG